MAQPQPQPQPTATSTGGAADADALAGAGPRAADASDPERPLGLAARARGKVALITGVTGQDGSYLAELLLSKPEYSLVVGLVRRSSSFNTGRIEHLTDFERHGEGGAAAGRAPARFVTEYGDLLDASSLVSLLARTRPHEVYNLAAQSHVAVSFAMPEFTADVDGLGVLRLLSAVRACGLERSTRVYQASTSELFGSQPPPQSEATPFHPRSPYACAKAFAHWSVVNHREAYGMFACSGILFNHESPRRGATFVTRKVTRAVARIAAGAQAAVVLGNLDATRDWGHARDYVRAMHAMLQARAPADYVVATGGAHSVRDFCESAFRAGGLPLEWAGERGSPGETGVLAGSEPPRVLVRLDAAYLRPAEVDALRGDAARARAELGWAPSVSFQELVEEMVAADIKLVAKGDLSS